MKVCRKSAARCAWAAAQRTGCLSESSRRASHLHGGDDNVQSQLVGKRESLRRSQVRALVSTLLRLPLLAVVCVDRAFREKAMQKTALVPPNLEVTCEKDGPIQTFTIAGRVVLSSYGPPGSDVSVVRVLPKCIDGAIAGAYAFFVANTAATRLTFTRDMREFASDLNLFPDSDSLVLYRDAFWQDQGPWLRARSRSPTPAVYCISEGRFYHPLRAIQPGGEIYRRYDHRLEVWFSLRTLSEKEDLELFSRWQNDRRVASFWEMSGTLDEHREYLAALGRDAHTWPVLGLFDEVPFAYFEIYWAKEDRIAPFYSAANYDRGIHIAIGNNDHRGPAKVRSWLSGLCHYIFTSEPRTNRIVSEPRFDNLKMINYMQAHRFAKIKNFDFPHKRASLMILEREAFFQNCDLS